MTRDHSNVRSRKCYNHEKLVEAWMKMELQKEPIATVEHLTQALATFFSFVDKRRTPMEVPTPEVNRALRVIIAYYSPRLIKYVRIQPSDCLRRVIESEELYSHAWAAFWKHGQRIKYRSLEGVFAFLRQVIHNHRCTLVIKYVNKLKLTDSLDQETIDSTDKNTGMKKELMRALSLTSEDLGVDDIIDRYDLLERLFDEAAQLLPTRQRELIQLSRQKMSPAEIMRAMNFTSINAVRSFKTKTFRALGIKLLGLLKDALNQPGFTLAQKEVIQDWLEHYCKYLPSARRAVRSRKAF